MTTEQFMVPGVSCQHCVRAVTEEVTTLAGVQKVEVNLANKVVTVEHTGALKPEQIMNAIKAAGYDEIAVLA
jgi:copper ion binding protein